MSDLMSILRGGEPGSVSIDAPRGVSSDLAGRIKIHNDVCADVIRRVSESTRGVAAAVAQAETSGSYGGLANAVDSVRVDKLEIAELAIQLWQDRGELARGTLAELKAMVPDAEAKLATVIADRREVLTREGQGPTATVGGLHGNTDVATHQFDAMIRQNDFVRPIIAELSALRSNVSAAEQSVSQSVRGEAAARSFIKRLALQLASV